MAGGGCLMPTLKINDDAGVISVRRRPFDAFIIIGDEDGIARDMRRARFQFRLLVNGSLVGVTQWPGPGVELKSSDQPVMRQWALPVRPDDSVTIQGRLWWRGRRGDVAEIIREGAVSYTVPRPDSPFASWVWDSDLIAWVAPVAVPQDGENYKWDEPSQSWVLPNVA